MPNWCYNYATFSHEDKAEMDKLRRAIEEKNVLETFIPTPEDKMADDSFETGWWIWRVNNWGSKWDLTDIDIIKDDGETIGIQFSTAWSPTTRAYDTMGEAGWAIEAYYSEMGMGFCGHYDRGEDDYFAVQEYSEVWIESNIPQDIIDACGLLAYVDEEEEA